MLIADPPAPPAPGSSEPPPTPEADTERRCSNCGSVLVPGQDWCLDCGQGAPGSTEDTPGWLPVGLLAAAAVVLVLAAAVTGYAALNQSSKTPPAPTITTVAQAPPVTTQSAPAPPVGATGATAVAPAVATTTTSAPVLATATTASTTSSVVAKPPPIPTTTPAPTPTVTFSSSTTVAPVVSLTTTSAPVFTTTPAPAVPAPPVTSTTSTTTTTTSTSTSTTTSASHKHKKPSLGTPLMLDPDATRMYNPYSYPASRFSDPALATDGDPTTAWTAAPDPLTGPRMAVGLLIDLKSPLRLKSVRLVTTTPGMNIELYGANGSAPPATITTPGWHHLAKPRNVTAHQIFAIRKTTKYRWILLWLTNTGSTSATASAAFDEVTLAS